MIDPIGLVGTLIAIVQVCSKVVSVCYEYKSNVKDAPKDASRILDEVASIRNISESLVKVAESELEPEATTLQLVQCLDELTQLKTVLKLDKGVKALRWPFKRAETEKRLVVIGRIKATLGLALAAGNAQKMLEVLEQTSKLPLIQEKVVNMAQIMDKNSKDDERLSILRWLGGREQSTKHQDEYKKCVEGTGDWLLQHQDYKDWKDSPGKLLWLNGNAGCGKTVLCSNVIENLQELCEDEWNIGLVYFYIDGSEQRPLTAEVLYRSIIAQLAPRLAELPPLLERLNRRYGPAGYNHHKPIPVHTWVNCMESMVHEFSRIYVVIDGLDECEESIGLEGIVGFIGKIMARAAGRVHAITFSRDLEQLRSLFNQFNATKISIAGESLRFDLEQALTSQLSANPKFSRWPRSLKSTVETSLLSQAHGSFRWLDCQLQSLKKCATPVAVRKALKDLPKSLEVYYSRVLEEVDASNRQSVKNLLLWVAFSFRPLSLNELTSALAINIDDKAVPFFDENLELLDIEGFLDSCSSVISTYYNTKDADGQPIVYVKLAHYTVKEFLGSDAVRNGSLGDFAMEKYLAHSHLTASCLAYFHHAVTSTEDDLWELNPLAKYAGHFWMKHEELSGDKFDLQTLSSIVLDLFDAQKPFFKHWMEVKSVDRPWLDEDATKPDDYIPIYCAAYNGLDWVVKALLAQGAPVEEKSGLYSLPLHAAAFRGHLSTVKVLIDAKVDVMAKGGLHGFAISAASANGHTEVVKELLAAGASPDCWDSWSRWQNCDALYLAANRGHLEVCELLLKSGAKDRWHMKSRPGSALHAAVQSGRLDIVKMMLRHQNVEGPNSYSHRDIIVEGSGGLAASQYSAAAAGDVNMLRELAGYGISKEQLMRYAATAGDKAKVLEMLGQGVSVDDKGCYSDHPRALQGAARAGHVEIVKELIKRGADVNAQENYSSPLNAPVESQNFEVVKILVDAGAQVDSPSLHPLDTALSLHSQEIVEFLIQHGAEINPALRRSALWGKPVAFAKLIKLGADINYRLPIDPPNMLHAAARGGAPAIINYLLDNGCDIDTLFNQVTPLMEAARSREWEAARMFIEHGADVNVLPADVVPEQGYEGVPYHNGFPWPPRPIAETCLTLAVKNEDRETARLLLAHGAWPNGQARSSEGTPLLYAVWEGYADLVKDLLEAGADPNQTSIVFMRKKKPSFPLLLSVERDYPSIFKLLIEAGANLNAQDAEGFSAVHLASHCYKPDILRMLVQDYSARTDFKLLNGSQPIHSAASKGSPEHVQILLDVDVDVNLKNDDGRTPLHWAAERGNWDTIDLLLEKGADVKVVSDEDSPNTAFDLAQLAKERDASWRYTRNMGNTWNEGKIDGLLERLR